MNVYWKVCIISSIANLYVAEAAVLLISNRKLDVSPLQKFTNREFEKLIEDLDHPVTHIFKCSNLKPGLRNIIGKYYTAYNPNGYIKTDKATILHGNQFDEEIILTMLREMLNESQSLLFAVITPERSSTLELQKRTLSRVEEMAKRPGPVFYIAKSNIDTYGMLYSTSKMILESKQFNMSLPPSLFTTYVISKKQHILTISLLLEYRQRVGFVNLTFHFKIMHNRQWALNRVTLSDFIRNASSSLTAFKTILYPMGLSYHCPDKTHFSNKTAGLALRIFDMQIEINATSSSFSESWDCIQVFSPGIWSGLSVAFVCGAVLLISITMIAEINNVSLLQNM